MRYLIDTHILIWALEGQGKLPKKATGILENPAHEIIISIVSLWEITIKKSLGKLDPPPKLHATLDALGYEILPIHIQHLETLQSLPHHHSDPFDRLLIAQAMHENLTLITSDKALKQYDAKIILA